MKPTNCDRCGKFDFYCRDLKSIYAMKELVWLCEECGEKADSFVKYYGKKKQEDKDKLKAYLVSGTAQLNKLNAMMNAGYH